MRMDAPRPNTRGPNTSLATIAGSRPRDRIIASSRPPIAGSPRAIGRRTMPPLRWLRAEAGSAFVRDRTGRVGDTLYVQKERRVGKDNTVKWLCQDSWIAWRRDHG